MSALQTALARIDVPHQVNVHTDLERLAPQAAPRNILDASPTQANAEKLRLRADLNHFPAMFKPSPEQLARADHPQHFTAKLNLNTNWQSLANNITAAQLSEDSFLLPYDRRTAFEILPSVRPVQLLNKAAVATGIPARVLRDELAIKLALMPFGLGIIKTVGPPLKGIFSNLPRTTKPAASRISVLDPSVSVMDLNKLTERLSHLRNHIGNIVGGTMSPDKKVEALKKLLFSEKKHLKQNAQDMSRLINEPDSPTTRLARQERAARRSYHEQLIQLLESSLERVAQFSPK